jgi:hypothetical protein
MKRRRLFFWAPWFLVGSIFAATVPASAADTPSLSALIISNPAPGWTPNNSGSSNAAGALYHDAQQSYSGQVETAVNRWLSPNQSSTLLIALIALIDPSDSSSVHQSLIQSAVRQGNGFCKDASGRDPIIETSIAAIPQGRILTCAPSKNGTVLFLATLVKANISAQIAAESKSQAIQIAIRQYAALPATDLGGSGNHIIWYRLAIGIAILLAVIVGIVQLTRRYSRRRRAKRAALPAPLLPPLPPL